MKKYFYTLLFLSFTTILVAQNFGGTPVPGVTVIKRSSSPTESAPSAKRTAAPTNTTATPPTTSPTGSSQEVGITEGQLSVSLTGGATYAIPIAVPPGINGVVPQVGLAYSSQSGNGIAGYGWNITGISAITRIPATTFHDGTIDAVDFDALDRFAFDGQRLVIKKCTSGAYGANETVYETESFSTVKITSYGVHPSGANYGPAYFIVQYPDGAIAHYGNSSDSRSITNYNITFWQNPQGVRINYNYFLDNNVLHISSIKYGLVNAPGGINEINFVYDPANRVRPEQYYIAGQSLTINQILQKIEVKGNGVGFRNYDLGYDETTLGYQRLISIAEKTGDNTLSYNPTVFSYETTPDVISYTPTTIEISLGSISLNNASTISGNFDGDENMDFIVYPTIGNNAYKKFWLFDRVNDQFSSNIGFEVPLPYKFEQLFTTKWINKNMNKLAPNEGITLVERTGMDINFNTYSFYNKETYLQSTKTFTWPEASNDDLDFGSLPILGIEGKYLEGDFNGDGITDVIAIRHKEIFMSNPLFGGNSTTSTLSNKNEVYFINLDSRLANNYTTFSGTLLFYLTLNSKFFVTDVDGNGKSDFLVFESNYVTAYAIDDNNQLAYLWAKYDLDIPIDIESSRILIGDYNGDGKTDFIIPKGSGNDFAKFTSTGKGFVKTDEIYDIVNNSNFNGNQCLNVFHIIPNDFDQDGKTDLTLVRNRACPDDETGFISVANFRNIGTNFVSNNFATTEFLYGLGQPAIPIFLNSNKVNNSPEINFIVNNKIFNFKSQKDFNKEKLLKSITTGNGVIETITYDPLLDGECYNNCKSVYLTSANYDTEIYPNTDIVNAPTFQIVSKLEKQSKSVYKKQEFYYHGAVANVSGLGFLGFKSTMQTNWHDANETNLISTVTKNDISRRGAPVESFSKLEFYSPKNATPTSNFITKSSVTYNLPTDALKANKVFKLKALTSQQFNGLDDTSSETITTYDGYNNPLQAITKLKNGTTVEQTTTATIVYDNQPAGTTYYIGRPTIKTQEVTTLSDPNVSSTQELYAYTNNLLTEIKKNSTNSGLPTTADITETNQYDSLGNITKKTISTPSTSPRVTDYEYNPAAPYYGRFLTKSKDVERLETTYVYNGSSGVLESETNPYNLTTSYLYDKWFKKRQTTDYLGKKNVYAYQRNDEQTVISTTGDDGSVGSELFDDLGRKIKSSIKNINGIFSNVDYEYDIYDRNYKVCEPYFGTAPTQWSETQYDEYGRPNKTISFTDKTVNITYTGLTTLVDEGYKSKSTTKNAIGNVVSMTDSPGGTITYTYFANGNLENTTFGQAVTIITQDGWGRKKTLKDPSAGPYEYEYNDLGEIKKETTPKGFTEYTYDDTTGKLLTKWIKDAPTPVNTNIKSEYEYDDATTKLLKKITVTNPIDGNSFFDYYYDPNKRLAKTVETTPQAVFTKEVLTFDDFGRVFTEKTTATAHGKSSTTTTCNLYKNGVLWQIRDTNATGKLLWEVDAENARGQVTNAKLGNDTNVSNTFDSYGYPLKISHNNPAATAGNLMTLETSFDYKRGNLGARSNSLFTTYEDFGYDNADRLTTMVDYPLDLATQCTFDNGFDGFTLVGSSSSLTNTEGKLRVNAANNDGLVKQIVTGATVNEVLYISFDKNEINQHECCLAAIPCCNNSKLWYQIYEKNRLDQTITFGFDQEVVEGTNEITYQVTSNSDIYIKFYIVPYNFNYNPFLAFTLDNLKVIVESPTITKTQNYEDDGRIKYNELGDYKYTTADKPYQNTSVLLTPEAEAYYTGRPTQTITYNAFKSPLQITEENHEIIDFGYNAMQQRSVMYYGSAATDKLARPYQKYYSADGSMEIKFTNDGTNTVEFITYIGGDAYSAPLVVKSDGTAPNTEDNYFYLHRDYQGSILAISNSDGAIVEKRLFDAWGAIVAVQDGAGNALTKLTFFDRGYTGHEHLEGVGLINMNARLYDPKLHRFLQPDNFVQDPSNTQNYNRYGYCYNNPFAHSDPSGEWIHILIGAVIGGVVNWAVHGCQFNAKGALAFGIGAAGGALISMGNTAGLSFFQAGMVTATYAVAGTMLTNMGNHVAFGDPMLSGKQLLTTAAISFVTGGLLRTPRAPVSSVSELTPAGTVPLQAQNTITATSGSTSLASSATNVAFEASEELAKASLKPITDGVAKFNCANCGIQLDAVNVAAKGGTNLVDKASGAYLLKFASGKFYAGKGLEPRMFQSISRIEKDYGTKLISKEFFEATSTNQALRIEHQIMMENGGPLSFDKMSQTYNLIHSPGAKLSGF